MHTGEDNEQDAVAAVLRLEAFIARNKVMECTKLTLDHALGATAAYDLE